MPSHPHIHPTLPLAFTPYPYPHPYPHPYPDPDPTPTPNQVEHHLFPRLPRHNLRKARELVKPICVKHGIHYHEPGFFAGNLDP